MIRRDGLLPNAWLVARREFAERVRSRLFVASTLLLALLAAGVSLAPVLVRVVDRGTTSTIAVTAHDDALATETISTLQSILGGASAATGGASYAFVRAADDSTVEGDVAEGRYDGALEADRDPSGKLAFRFVSGPTIGADRAQFVQVGALLVAILDWTAANHPGASATPFQMPSIDLVAATGTRAADRPIGAAEIASRRVVGIVFEILIFITIVIYGMWVAAGVVAEKSSRVMELLISAASPGQLVAGKVAGIGLAGLVQYVAILVPALATLALEDRIAAAVVGGGSLGVDLSVITPGLLLGYGAFWILGFVLYSLVYAAAGSLVSRPEDLQVLALPLSLMAIVGYLLAVGSLSGGISNLIRVGSLVPFWSPFIMLTRLTVSQVEPVELFAAYAFLIAAIAIVGVVAVRVYSAGVLLYGQRPGLRAIAGAVVHPPV